MIGESMNLHQLSTVIILSSLLDFLVTVTSGFAVGIVLNNNIYVDNHN